MTSCSSQTVAILALLLLSLLLLRSSVSSKRAIPTRSLTLKSPPSLGLCMAGRAESLLPREAGSRGISPSEWHSMCARAGDPGRAVPVTYRRGWSQKFSMSIRGPRKVSPNPIGGREEDAEEPQKGGQEAGRKKDRERACDAGEMRGWL